ncbi:MAG: phospholipase A [Lacisediminimonas sp.]|nr:phospholipase A [Lacisediminimonas sp.]
MAAFVLAPLAMPTVHNEIKNKMNLAQSLLLLLALAPVLAHAVDPGITECAAVRDNPSRLACFDRLAAQHLANEPAQPAAASVTATDVTAANEPAPAKHIPTALSEHWELMSGDKRGTFGFRPHGSNYLMATYTRPPNDAPYESLRHVFPDGRLSHAELSYQLSFKMKVLEQPADRPVDIWFAYTQKSFWQAANGKASSPFRETNYEPEIMAVMPIDASLLGFKARFLNIGMAHQSNGQTSTLSRSWNRIYAQVGAERGNFSLLARVWRRLGEEAAQDDNPDITDFLGHGDLQGSYRLGGHEFSALLRHNHSTGKGARQLAWTFPVAHKLKGYVQFFNGYGQSLIDYKHTLNSVGMGVLMSY